MVNAIACVYIHAVLVIVCMSAVDDKGRMGLSWQGAGPFIRMITSNVANKKLY